MSWEKTFLWNVPNPEEPFRTLWLGVFLSCFPLILFSSTSCSHTDDVHTSLLIAPMSRTCRKLERATWSWGLSVASVCLWFWAMSGSHHNPSLLLVNNKVLTIYYFNDFHLHYFYLNVCMCGSVWKVWHVWHVTRGQNEAWVSSLAEIFGITFLLLEKG